AAFRRQPLVAGASTADAALATALLAAKTEAALSAATGGPDLDAAAAAGRPPAPPLPPFPLFPVAPLSPRGSGRPTSPSSSRPQLCTRPQRRPCLRPRRPCTRPRLRPRRPCT